MSDHSLEYVPYGYVGYYDRGHRREVELPSANHCIFRPKQSFSVESRKNFCLNFLIGQLMKKVALYVMVKQPVYWKFVAALPLLATVDKIEAELQ